MKQLLSIFPFIHQTKLELDNQNKFLNKVTLTGKINALQEAANLFEFTDTTVSIFEHLIHELIEALLKENLYKTQSELDFKSKTAIDILIRNLFERTADVGFLATDAVIIEFLTEDTISLNTMQERLIQYTKKYSVYNEIIVFDLESNVKVNINPSNPIQTSNDPVLQEVLQTDEYIESYTTTDIFPSQEKTLLYSQKIMKDGKPIGILCLCFKLENELESIFSQLSNNAEVLILADNNGTIYSNVKNITQVPFSSDEYTIIPNKGLVVTNKTTGYQGYNGIQSWYTTAQSTHISKCINTKDEAPLYVKENTNLLEENLLNIIEKANDLIDDIADVIINGELIAAKRKVYVLTPILDSLRNISTDLHDTIKHSVLNLEQVVKDALIHDVKMASHLAIDIMDRNLYERANDSRWWALTPLFAEELNKDTPNISILNETLIQINKLYTVYTNIFIYNNDLKIIAASNDSSIIGSNMNDEYATQTLKNKDSQKYFVSDFMKNDFYNQEATYIYSATINAKKAAGIAVVFDSTIEFQEMLKDSFPKNKDGFSVFVDKERKIIATSSPVVNVLDILDIDQKYFSHTSSHAQSHFIKYKEIKYIIGIAVSQGYREYKNKDNYKNTIFAITFVKI